MAKSKYEYVRLFETDDTLLHNCWIVVRVDGRGFHRFSEVHKFQKPNDENALLLMNAAAEAVMLEFGDIVLAFGQSDEYSFVFRKGSRLYRRRESKIVSNVASLFASNYVLRWAAHMPRTPLEYAPSFDARAVLYPSDGNLRDYLSWRQADTHINNLYNTTFWSLVSRGGLSEIEAEEALKGTRAGDKNEILFSRFGINYASLPELYRKGTVLVWKEPPEESVNQPTPTNPSVVPGTAQPAARTPPLCNGKEDVIEHAGPRPSSRKRKAIVHLNVDVIGDQFWAEHSHVLAG